jgi:hypothetical protein
VTERRPRSRLLAVGLNTAPRAAILAYRELSSWRAEDQSDAIRFRVASRPLESLHFVVEYSDPLPTVHRVERVGVWGIGKAPAHRVTAVLSAQVTDPVCCVPITSRSAEGVHVIYPRSEYLHLVGEFAVNSTRRVAFSAG